MPNPLNFGSPIGSMVAERPYRLLPNDQQLMVKDESFVVFGKYPTDRIEVWIYNTDGTLAVEPLVYSNTSDVVSISTETDAAGTYELLNLDFNQIFGGILPGRYAVSIYLFHNEVSNYEEKRLYISKISSDKTEVTLRANLLATDTVDETVNAENIEKNNTLTTEMYEFATPSVPRSTAKMFIDQLFGKDNQEGGTILLENILANMNSLSLDSVQTITSKMDNAFAKPSFTSLFNYVKEKVYTNAMGKLKNRETDYDIQHAEIIGYISEALDEELAHVVNKEPGSVSFDPRFNLV